MSFRLTAEQRAVREAVRAFGEAEIRPVAREYEADERYPHGLLEAAADLDFVAPNVPEEYGGAGMDPVSELLVTEELWRADPGIGGSISAARFGTEMLLEYGDDWMKEQWLPKITAGETPICTGISEPAHGSDVAGMETTAERSSATSRSDSHETTAEKDGDEFVVDGQKMWITNGTVADVAIIMARTGEKGHGGISALLTPTDVDGYEATRIDNKLGIRAQDTAEIVLDGLRIPAENVVGEVDRGFYQLMEFFAPARADVAAQATGVAQAALDAALDYADEREQFDRKISAFQAIQHKLAEMATNVEAARSMAYRAGAAIEAGDDALATKLASMAKLFASERAVDVTDEALQVHGVRKSPAAISAAHQKSKTSEDGAGYVTDHPVEQFYRDARITKIYDGTSEIQKNIIADHL